MTNTVADTIIIGAGTAGCLLANRLSADASKRILLIEAGRKDDYHWVHVPVGYMRCMENLRTDWMYKTESNQKLNGRQIPYALGKILGGSSSINRMIYMRGQARDYDSWAAITRNPEWSWSNCLPFFKLHEDHHSGIGEYHGVKGVGSEVIKQDETLYGQVLRHRKAGGEWRVEKQASRWNVLDAFSAAAQQAGIPASADFNQGNNEGVGYFEINQHEGWRWNTAKAFLRPKCYGRPNFELWTSAQVNRLILEKQADGSLRCTGVEVWTGNELITAHASREVILSAGAVGSPKILQLSGIGPGDLLKDNNIEVKVDLPGVGANLQDHLQISSVYKVDGVPNCNTQFSSLWGKARMGLEYALKRSGPMSMVPSQLGIFTRSDPDQPWPNIEYHIQASSLDKFNNPVYDFSAISINVSNLNPTSRGCVSVRSPDFKDPPSISPNYLSTVYDQKIAIDSLRLTRNIASQPAFSKFNPKECKPGIDFQSDSDILHTLGDVATPAFHPAGTTAMGHDSDPMAVLDSRLHVRDSRGGVIAGLRVVDAGVMPVITSGDINSPTLMIAEKAARWILRGE
jgi:choline dehydrogenase